MMTIREALDQLPADSSLVYGEPHQTADGTTVITVARVGGLLRPGTRPVGVFVIHNGEVTWKPAVDDTQIALLGVLIGLLATVFTTLAILRRPPWPDLSASVMEKSVGQLRTLWPPR